MVVCMKQRSGYRLALDMALGEDTSADDWLIARQADGASLRTIADEVSELIGTPVRHTTIDNWLAAIRDERTAA